eukprot:2979653-Amphidinium_carterae.1
MSATKREEEQRPTLMRRVPAAHVVDNHPERTPQNSQAAASRTEVRTYWTPVVGPQPQYPSSTSLSTVGAQRLCAETPRRTL